MLDFFNHFRIFNSVTTFITDNLLFAIDPSQTAVQLHFQTFNPGAFTIGQANNLGIRLWLRIITLIVFLGIDTLEVALQDQLRLLWRYFFLQHQITRTRTLMHFLMQFLTVHAHRIGQFIQIQVFIGQLTLEFAVIRVFGQLGHGVVIQLFGLKIITRINHHFHDGGTNRQRHAMPVVNHAAHGFEFFSS